MVVYDNFGCHEHGERLFLWQRITLDVVMETVALFYAAVTLAMPQIYLASNVVSGIRCERIPCSSSEHCPAWHHCNMQDRICDPCTVCRDGSDANWRTPNCRDPVRCIDALYAKQDYACPKLRIADGYSCLGVCRSCGGPLGSYLGTTCRVDCSDFDSEVFSCIFLNERAQWNVSRIPHWILRVTTSPPPAQPPASSASTPPLQHMATSPAAYQHHHLEALAGIVAGTVLGVAVIVFFAVALVVCVRRLKRPVEQLLEESNEQQQQEQQQQQQQEQQKEQQHDWPLVEPQLHQQIPASQNLPEENADTATTLDAVVRTPVEVGSSESWWRSSLPHHATEMSDYDSYHTYAHPSPPTAEQVSLLKGYEQRRSFPSLGQSVISLRSERSMPVRQPQEHSPPPGHWPALLHPPPAGSPDSGHPPCRYSSSNSLQHETLRKSVSDIATAATGVYRREPTEQESQEESSSGLHIPDEDSIEDVNTGYCV